MALAGHGGYNAPADKKASSIVDFITPETGNVDPLLLGMARNFKPPQDPSLTTQIRDGQGKILPKTSRC